MIHSYVSVFLSLALLGGGAASLSGAPAGPPVADRSLKTIALTGDIAPGTGGRRFDRYEAPVINDLGAVSFAASLECCTPRGTVFSTGTGSLSLVAWEGSPAEPGGLNTFNEFGDIQIDNLGRTMIRSEMSNLPREFNGLYVGQANEMLTRIAVSGQAVDLGDPATKFYLISFPKLGSGGVLAGRAVSVTNGDRAPGIDVLFKSNGHELAQPVLRAGDQLDFLPDGVVIGAFFTTAFDRPVVNSLGQIAVRSETIDTRGSDIQPFGSHVLLIEPDNSYSSAVNQGDPLPSSANLGAGLEFSELSLPVLNDRGAVAFGAYAGGFSSETLWRKRADHEPELIASQRSEPPGMPGVIFDDFFLNNSSEMPLWISDRGDVAFWAGLAGGPFSSDTAESAWIGSPGDLRPILIEGEEAPGTGGVFASMRSTHGDLIQSMAVNNRSQAAVLASFELVPGQRRDGLFATDQNGILQKIVVPGDFLEVIPGVFREVQAVNFKGDAFEREGTGLNDLGEITFAVTFTDGTHGAFVSSAVAVPEPASLMMIVGMLSVAWVTRPLLRRLPRTQR